MSRVARVRWGACTALLMVLACLFWPALGRAADTFDPHDYPRQDLIYLQAALSFQGQYAGLLDGAWGPLSQKALEQYALRADKSSDIGTRHLTALVRSLDQERRMAGWRRINNDATGVSMLLPLSLLRDTGDDRRHLTYTTPSGDLLVRWIVESGPKTAEMHDWARRNNVGDASPYSHATDQRVITSATLNSGRRVYLRSSLIDGGYITLLIQSEPAQYNRAALIAASLSDGPAPDLAVTPGGPLAALLTPETPGGGSIARAGRVAPLPTPSRAPRSSGTGFFVNATDVVTAAHVIDQCSGLTLADGTPLTPMASDGDADLAVLQADRRSAHWLPLRNDPKLRLGQGVAAVGYPFISLSGGALNLTMGNVSALSTGAGHPDWVAISAPVQPGNSGGPLLSSMGEVVGVVVARADDRFYLRETGTLPQNMNYAVRLSRLRRFLDGAAIPLPSDEPDPAPLSDGLSDGKQAAIQPVLCY